MCKNTLTSVGYGQKRSEYRQNNKNSIIDMISCVLEFYEANTKIILIAWFLKIYKGKYAEFNT